MSWFKELDAQARVALIATVVGAFSGLLGGIVGPVIQSRFQQSADSAKVRLEADLGRQTKFIEAVEARLCRATCQHSFNFDKPETKDFTATRHCCC